MCEASEVGRGDRVAVINEAAARLWPAGVDPLGDHLRLSVLEQAPPRSITDATRTPEVRIVGIIADTRNAGLRSQPVPAVILPYSVIAPAQRVLAVRTSGDSGLLLNPIRAAVREIDPEQPLTRPITVAEILGQEVEQPRFTMALFTTFAALGLLLAAAGIYSVLSFHVTLRTHEMGVRMALGANRGDILRLTLLMGGRLVATGAAVGVVASLAATRLLRSELFGVEPADPLAYAAIVIVLGLVAFLACYVPAHRAARVDAITALRQD
jgi:putative ABC transport system permease protein